MQDRSMAVAKSGFEALGTRISRSARNFSVSLTEETVLSVCSVYKQRILSSDFATAIKTDHAGMGHGDSGSMRESQSRIFLSAMGWRVKDAEQAERSMVARGMRCQELS